MLYNYDPKTLKDRRREKEGEGEKGKRGKRRTVVAAAPRVYKRRTKKKTKKIKTMTKPPTKSLTHLKGVSLPNNVFSCLFVCPDLFVCSLASTAPSTRITSANIVSFVVIIFTTLSFGAL